MEVKCEFRNVNWDDAFNYTCFVTSATIEVPSTLISSFKGQHHSGKSNEDVNAICFKDTTVKFMPEGLADIFQNLTHLDVLNCGLKEISNADLLGLGKLEVLWIRANKLEAVPNDLFLNMPKLRVINFCSNLLERFEPETLLPIIGQLEILNLKNNQGLDEVFDKKTPNALENFLRRVRECRQKQHRINAKRIAELEDRMPKKYDRVKFVNCQNRKRILITGGAGFVGSHLVDYLMRQGHNDVMVADNYFTGRKSNVEDWIGHKNFELIHHDIVNPLFVEVDEIYHLASPASPIHYMYNPVKTIKTNTLGTINMLGLARRVGAKILIASTSEVYGDPDVHPQPETYWGHVNPIGPRACYDEGKRVAETLSYAYAKQENVDVRVARIFNTYGPRMRMNDGRVVGNFILQALKGDPITIYGNGKQTRSFQYVSDLVDGLVALMNSNYTQPVNLGNPQEHTIEEFAEIIHELVGGNSEVLKMPAVEDDPQRRKPDITRAKTQLNWEPRVALKDGLKKTMEYFKSELESQHE